MDSCVRTVGRTVTMGLLISGFGARTHHPERAGPGSFRVLPDRVGSVRGPRHSPQRPTRQHRSFLRYEVEMGDDEYVRAWADTSRGHRPLVRMARRRGGVEGEPPGRRLSWQPTLVGRARRRRRRTDDGTAGVAAVSRSGGVTRHPRARRLRAAHRNTGAPAIRRRFVAKPCPTRVFRALRRAAARSGRTRHASNPRSACPTARSRRWPGSGAERAGPGGCGYTNRWRPR